MLNTGASRYGSSALVLKLDPQKAQPLKHAAQALRHLLRSYYYARDLKCNRWEFSLDIQCLRRDGLREADLRWLMLSGLLEQAHEQTMLHDRSRRFRHARGTMIGPRSCFLLTDEGATVVDSMLQSPEFAIPSPVAYGVDPITIHSNAKPCWDQDRRILLFSEHVVKRFRVAAPNQETVLAAFQEEDWPVRIDDPLPNRVASDAKRRLHDTIVALNRNRRAKAIRFFGDGSGEGIRWEIEVPQIRAESA